MPTATRDLMSTSEAARCLGIAAETLRSWVRAGTLPATVTPLGMLFDAGDVEALRQRRLAASVAPRVRGRRKGGTP